MGKTAFVNKHSILGHTLLELMIASSLGSFVLAGMLQISDNSQQNNRVDRSLTEIQENGRYAIDQLSSTLSYRGYQGCLTPVTLSVSEEDNVNWDNASYTAPVALNFPFSNLAQSAMRGYEVDENGVWTPDPQVSPQDTDIQDIKAGVFNGLVPVPGSDVISVQYASSESLNLESDMNSVSDNVFLGDTTLTFNQNDLVFIGDCALGDLFRVSNVPGSTPPIMLQHLFSHNTSSALRRPYTTDAQVRTFHVLTYFVADTGRKTPHGDPVYSLYRKDINDNVDEIIEGVESLQLLYGEQLSSDNVRFLKADAVDLNMRRVVRVRMGLLMQGLIESTMTEDTQTYELPGASIAPPTGSGLTHQGGRYMRKVFTKTVELRNRA